MINLFLVVSACLAIPQRQWQSKSGPEHSRGADRLQRNNGLANEASNLPLPLLLKERSQSANFAPKVPPPLIDLVGEMLIQFTSSPRKSWLPLSDFWTRVCRLLQQGKAIHHFLSNGGDSPLPCCWQLKTARRPEVGR